ncbi:MAG TPA: FixH family protein [Gemmataceae bacterium]
MKFPRWLAAGLLALAAAGCSGPGSDAAPDIKVELAFQPSPPKVGAAEATVTLADAGGQPVRGAAVKLEGNMNHAGMAPAFADAKETEPGHYKAEMNFTMGGDWFVLVNATLADGRKITRKVDVRGVKR